MFSGPLINSERGDELKKKLLIIVFILLFAGVAGVVYFAQKNAGPHDLFFSGIIETTQANLSFQAPGRVAGVYVREGQDVTKGALVAELDRAEYQARYEQARAALERARQSQKQAQMAYLAATKTLPAEVNRAEAGLKSAEDVLADAEKNYLRFEELFRQGVVTEKERDSMKLGYDVAQSRLDESRSVLNLARGNLVRIDIARRDIDAAAAQVDVARAAVDQAAVQLDYTQLRSPMDAVVISRNIEPGETVNPGREVITVSDLSRVDLKIYVPETQIGKVRPGGSADVTIDTFPDKTFAGIVAFVSPEGEFTPKIIQTKKERVKLVYLVKVSIDNPLRELKAGMPADARLHE